MAAAPVPPPVIPVLAERGGTPLKAPRAVVLVDTREQKPFDLSRFTGWFSGIENRARLDSAITALPAWKIPALWSEKISMIWFTRSPSSARCLLSGLRRVSSCPHRLLVITTTLSQIKSSTSIWDRPQSIVQSLIVPVAGLHLPFVTTETHELSEVIFAS